MPYYPLEEGVALVCPRNVYGPLCVVPLEPIPSSFSIHFSVTAESVDTAPLSAVPQAGDFPIRPQRHCSAIFQGTEDSHAAAGATPAAL